MAGGLEMVRVRVLFLEPGDKIHPSWLDDAITDVMLADRNKRSIREGAEYEEDGYYKLCQEEFVDSLIHSRHDSNFGQSPNDPCVEMLKPMVAVYFDMLENNSDWESGQGQLGFSVESIGTYEVFHKHTAQFIEYARCFLNRKSAHKSVFGTKVQFMTMWSCWTAQSDSTGEWDSGENLLGVFHHSEITVTPMKWALQMAQNWPKTPLKEDLFSV